MKDLFDKIKGVFLYSLGDTLCKVFTFRDLFISSSSKCLMHKVKKTRCRCEQELVQLRSKDKIVVAFFLQSPSVWKYDRLYESFVENDRFDPYVVVCPFNVHLNYDKREMRHVMDQSVAFVKHMNYQYINSYDSVNDKWIDIRKTLNPDIIFYTKPYKDTLPQYHIYRFLDKLNCYAPYGIGCVDLYRTNYNLPFNNLLWRHFVPTEAHLEDAVQHSFCKGDNVQVVGSLGMEPLMLQDYTPVDVWKPQQKRKKRIIWAPHHTVDYLFNFSNFFTYCDFMLELASRYQEEIQIAFKPHPVLKFKLINIWGKERTEAYYQRWNDLPNGQLEDGYYTDLFMTSDAMIHDCATFTAEYLYTKKPTMFLVKDNPTDHMNYFGKMCFDLHYHAHQPSDVENYIKDVVIGGNDSKSSERNDFYKRYLYPKDGVMPSQKIVDTIVEAIG